MTPKNSLEQALDEYVLAVDETVLALKTKPKQALAREIKMHEKLINLKMVISDTYLRKKP